MIVAIALASSKYTVLLLPCTVSAKTLYAIATRTVFPLSDAIAFAGSARSGLHERNKR
jgi:hypothetical protein